MANKPGMSMSSYGRGEPNYLLATNEGVIGMQEAPGGAPFTTQKYRGTNPYERIEQTIMNEMNPVNVANPVYPTAQNKVFMSSRKF